MTTTKSQIVLSRAWRILEDSRGHFCPFFAVFLKIRRRYFKVVDEFKVIVSLLSTPGR